MKKRIYIILAVVSCFAYVACQKAEEPVAKKLVDVTLNAGAGTRTFMTSGFDVIWDDNDKIRVVAESGNAYQFAIPDGMNSYSSATFRGQVETSDASSLSYAIYPYTSDGSITIPATQTMRSDGTFETNVNPSYAEINGINISFSNLAGCVGIRLAGDASINNAVIIDKNGGNIAGKGGLDGEKKLALSSECSSRIQLSRAENLSVNGLKLIFVSAPNNYSEGLQACFYNQANKSWSTAFSSFNLAAGKGKGFDATINDSEMLSPVSWANIQWNSGESISAGDTFSAGTKIEILGYTNENDLTAETVYSDRIKVQLGRSSSSSDPATGDWVWENCWFNGDWGNEIYYQGNLSSVPAGTYSYCFRIIVDGRTVYAGTNGLYDGSSNVCRTLTVS